MKRLFLKKSVRIEQAYFGEANPAGGGPFLSSQQIFILSRRDSPGGPTDEQLFGEANPAGGGPFLPSQQIFILSREGSPGAPTDEQLFARQNFLGPAIGLSYPDMTLLALALLLPLGPKTYIDSRQRPTAANDGEYRQLVSVCNTSRREASSSLLR